MLPPIPPDDLLPPFTETDWRYARAIAERGDTYLHLPTLRKLTELCSFDYDEGIDTLSKIRVLRQRICPVDVVEFGVRGVCTTWAFLAAKPRSLVSVDIAEPPPMELQAAVAAAMLDGTDFTFVKADTLTLEPIPCDLLFIDTRHTYDHLRAELHRHASSVRRFIAFHDTIAWGFIGDDGREPGLQQAIEELVAGEISGTGKWALKWHDERCNGLAVVERII